MGTYEIICVDDCSQDETYAELKELAEEHSEIRLLRNEKNGGVSYSRNRLVQEARGEYIWFVDPDDMLYPNAAITMIENARKNDLVILFGNYERVSEETKIDDYRFHQEVEEKKDYMLLPPPPTDSNGRHFWSVWGGVIRRDFIIDNKLFMNEKMTAQEDTLFYYEVFLRTDKVSKIDKLVYLYRVRKSSVCHTKSAERNKRYYLSMREMLRVYEEHYKNKDYRSEEQILEKIHHSKQNVATTLASIPDEKYIKEQLKELKALKIYPYKFRKEALKSGRGLLGVLEFLMPIKLFFWLYHWVYNKRYKQ